MPLPAPTGRRNYIVIDQGKIAAWYAGYRTPISPRRLVPPHHLLHQNLVISIHLTQRCLSSQQLQG